ncbi:MAG TPA: nucleotide exchange factor GrpE [Pyrinomonadaceae bacterium]|nr:nucleotide exchange factor GrpE [Pyrinomonadaceae bacterium]
MSRFGRDRRGAWDEDEPRDIRVTDRRRIHLDDEGETAAPATEVPNLKPTYVEELEARTRAAEQKVQEVQARFEQLRQQLQSETDETRRRLNKAADERAHREKANFIEALLPVLDNLQRATESAQSGASAEDVAEGVRRTAANFENALVAAGVEPLESVGEQFNPELHDAVETAEVEPEDEGKVLEEYARGYRIGDRLLRPARVKVGRASARAKAVE